MINEISSKLRLLHPNDFEVLIKFISSLDIKFTDCNLKGPYGMSTIYGIYLDMDKIISRFHPMMIKYIILHEIGHYKRITKLGKEQVIKNLSLENYDEFCDSVIFEEIIADRYACLVYLRLERISFPIEATQKLHLPINALKYRNNLNKIFGYIKNSEDNYKELLKNFI